MGYYVRTPKQPFVYGQFLVATGITRPPAFHPGLPPPPNMAQPFAIEILREPSANELIGKLYVRTGSSWAVANRALLQGQRWYDLYTKNTAIRQKKTLRFEMEGSGIWRVENIREESDENGPYFAVALLFTGA